MAWLRKPAIAKYADFKDPRVVDKWFEMGLRFCRLPNNELVSKVEWIDEFLESFEQGLEDRRSDIDRMADEITSELSLAK